MKSNLENILLPSLKKAEKKRDRFLDGTDEYSKRSDFLSSYLDGKFLDEAETVYLVTKEYELSYPRQELDTNILKYAGIKNIGWEDLLFIDTETTGLSRGTGTYVFLVGIGFWKESRFCEELYFLADLCGERLMMNHLLERIYKFKSFVSYNGKSFDIPLLQTRLIMSEIDFDLKQIPNLDLLHLTRRFLRNRFDSFSLQNMEKYLLGIRRDMEEDIPGAEIPKVYLDYLSHKFSDKIVAIVNHNKQDILSLTVLLEKLNQFILQALRGENVLADFAGIGKFLEDMENMKAAEQVYSSCPIEDSSCRKNLSFIYKRNNRADMALPLWRKAAELNEVYAIIELAKYEEHQNEDFKQALYWCDLAIEQLSSRFWIDQEKLEELMHRKERLFRRIAS